MSTAGLPPPDAPPQSATVFWSIERFVAFLLGPAVAAGAGWLSTWLAREIGIHVSAESMVVVFGTGSLAAGALAYKWLHGRQIEMQVNAFGGQLASGIVGGQPSYVAPVAPPATPSAIPPDDVQTGVDPIPPAGADPAPTGEVPDTVPAAGEVPEAGADEGAASGV